MPPDSSWDDLIAEARLRFETFRREEDGSAELGERVALGVGEAFVGRWRGLGQMHTKDGTRDVYLVWGRADEPLFFYMLTRLRAEIDALEPPIAVGDDVAIVRGDDVPATSPDRNPMQRFAVRHRPSAKPLPAGSIPF